MKRFTDTELWKKPWFMDLTPPEKLAFFYIKDQCDNVGVWTPNFRLAEFMIGTQLDWDKFADKCNRNIFVMENGKWWLVDFCSFQHQDLKQNPDGGNSNALKSYVKLLREHKLYDYFLNYLDDPLMGIRRASGGHPHAPKERVKEEEREREREREDCRTSLHPHEKDCNKEQLKGWKKAIASRGSVDYPPGFSEVWDKWPKASDKKAAAKAWIETLISGADYDKMVIAVDSYLSCNRETDTKYIKQLKTFFGSNEPWRDYAEKKSFTSACDDVIIADTLMLGKKHPDEEE